jgi:hypothetical protein
MVRYFQIRSHVCILRFSYFKKRSQLFSESCISRSREGILRVRFFYIEESGILRVRTDQRKVCSESFTYVQIQRQEFSQSRVFRSRVRYSQCQELPEPESCMHPQSHVLRDPESCTPMQTQSQLCTSIEYS